MRIPGKIPVFIHPLFWVFAFLIGWLNAGSLVGTLIWAVVILVSLLVHEFGHALSAVAFGQNAQIELMFFGGRTLHTGKKISLPKEFVVTFCGPFAGLLLCGVSFGILHLWERPPAIIDYGLQISVLVNLIWTILNLFPVLPLDGGHLLRIVLEGLFGAKGLSAALIIGLVIGAGAAVLAFFMGAFLIGAIFFILAFECGRSWRSVRHLSEKDRDEGLQQRFSQAEQQMQQGNLESALDGFQEVRKRAGQGLLYIAATEGAARLLEERGDLSQAYEYLKEIRKKLPAASLPLLHRLAYRNGDLQLAIEVGPASYQASNRYDVAYINALAHASLGEVQASIGWLKCAVRDGLPDLSVALEDKAFDPIRNDPSFQELDK